MGAVGEEAARHARDLDVRRRRQAAGRSARGPLDDLAQRVAAEAEQHAHPQPVRRAEELAGEVAAVHDDGVARAQGWEELEGVRPLVEVRPPSVVVQAPRLHVDQRAEQAQRPLAERRAGA